jgi:hypothetical protein
MLREEVLRVPSSLWKPGKQGVTDLQRMCDQQSQAHSTHQSSLNDRFKKTLRLNRDQIYYYLPGLTWYREHMVDDAQLP